MKPFPLPLVAWRALNDFAVDERNPRLRGLNVGFRVFNDDGGVGLAIEGVNDEVPPPFCYSKYV